MATLFGRIGHITRGSGKSAVGAAAYRSCSKMFLSVTDKQTNISFDVEYNYSKKKGLEYSAIHAPEHAPEWVYDRQTLWQTVEDVETKSNARLADEYIVALPKEFTVEQNIELLKEFVEQSFVSRGLVVDVNFHNDNPNNPHAHIMYALRELKQLENGEIGFSTHRYRALQTNAFLYAIKEEHKQLINERYAKYGYEYRLEWGAAPGQASTIHHGGMRETILRNEQIIRQNAEKIISDPSIVIDKLDFNKAVFSRDDIEKELEKALAITLKNLPVAGKEDLDNYVKDKVVEMLDVVLLSSKLTMVNPCDLRGRTLFAKTVTLDLENRFIANAKELAQQREHVLDIKDSDIKPFAAGKEFSQQQKEVIKLVCASGNLSVLEGWPGSGKSTVTREIVRQYKEAGYEIVAAAPTNKAAQELSEKLGIEVLTTSKLRMKWQYERGAEKVSVGLRADYYKDNLYNIEEGALKEKSLLVLDEASMLNVATSDYFVSEAKKSGAKLFALGDNNQNQAIGSKGSFAHMGDIGQRNLLTEINRHRNEDESIRDLHIEATSALCNYRPLKAISIYEGLNKINILDNEEEKQVAISRRYVSKIIELANADKVSVIESTKKVVVNAYTNAEINNLNSLIRTSLKRAGVLPEEGMQFISGGVNGKSNMVELCEGDRIIFTSNLSKKDGYGGVLNNELATIERIVSSNSNGQGEFIATVDGAGGARQVRIRTGEEGRIITFRHGYAITNYAVQGVSKRISLYSVDRYSGFETSMVGLTRHIEDCEIYAANNTLEDEVYKTKDLDVEKVREEYSAIGYEPVTTKREDGKEITEKVTVPLWKLGLGLLVSKRSNLSFAIDNRYGHIEIDLQQSYEALQASYENIRAELEIHERAIEHYEQLASTPLITEENISTDDIKGVSNAIVMNNTGSDDGQAAKNIETGKTQLELHLEKHFEITGAVQLDVKGMLAANSLKSMSPGEDEKHIETLKSGVMHDGGHSKLKWDELAINDQYLILASYIDKDDLSKLSERYNKITILQEELQIQGEAAAKLFNEIQAAGLDNHKMLDGNHGAVRDYLESRARVRAAYKLESELNKKLNSARVQKALIAAIEDKYGVKLKYLTIDRRSINEAANAFENDLKAENDKNLEKNKNYQPKELDQFRREYLTNVIKSSVKSKDFKMIVENSKKLVVDIIESAKLNEEQTSEQGGRCNTLSSLSKEISFVVEELDEAKDIRSQITNKLLSHYDGHVDGNKDQPVISKILAQINCNYHTLEKHAGVSEEKHYFSKIVKESLGKNPDYNQIMQSISIAQERDLSNDEVVALIESHDNLCVHTDITQDYIEELKQERFSMQSEKQRITKEIDSINTYQKIEFPQFIKSIYEDDSKTLISELNRLISSASDHNQLAINIADNPEMLGKIKERGLVAKIFRSNAAKLVDSRLTDFTRRITEYIEGCTKMDILKTNQKSANYEQSFKDIDKLILDLKKSLPSADEIDLLHDMGSIESKALSSKEVNRDSVINVEKFAANINKLFREDKTLDVLFNYQIKHNLFLSHDPNKLEATEEKSLNTADNNKAHSHNKQRNYNIREQVPKITFEQVNEALNSSHIEDIFRQYTPIINGKSNFEKRGQELQCGSISISLKNERLGRWYRFSDNSKGNIYKLVQEATGCTVRESLEIIADKVGVKPLSSISLESANKNSKKPLLSKSKDHNKSTNQELQNKWVAVGIVPKSAPKFNANKHLSYLKNKRARVSLVHEYRNKDDQLLGYTVRVEEKSGKKQVLPVAWCHNKALGKSNWNLKGFDDNGSKPIYGLQKISYEPLKPVVIVEGEKTADRAQKLLPDYNVISWMGGVQGIHNVNWSNLKHKEVIIWPDNDRAGFGAAQGIAEHIDNHNGFTGMVSIVDTAKLKLPEKWDLADKLPEHLQGKAISELIADTKLLEIHSSINVRNKIEAGNIGNMLDGKTVDLHNSVDMLEAKGKIDRQEYTSKDMYMTTLASIAANKNIDLSKHNSFIDNILILQNEYERLQAQYTKSISPNNPGNKAASNNKREGAVTNIVRDTAVLHGALLGRKQLTKTHQQLIYETTKTRIDQLKACRDSDISHVASLVYQETSSSSWIGKLVQHNAEQTKTLKNTHIEQRNQREITKNLQSVSLHLTLMDKMGLVVDKKAFSDALKSKSYKEKEEYADHIVGAAVKNHLAPQIKDLKEERAKATDIDSLLKIMRKEHEFFSDLKDDHEVSVLLTKDKELISNMNIAGKFNKEEMFSCFEKLVNHIADHDIIKREELQKTMKDSKDIHQLSKNLNHECTSYYKNMIDHHLEHIEHKHELHIEDHTFRDQVSYLQHLQKHPHHELMPHDHINQHLQRIEQHNQDQESAKQKELHLNLHMGDPSL